MPCPTYPKISDRSVHNFSSYLADSQKKKQTNKNQQKQYLRGGGNKTIFTKTLYLPMNGWRVPVITMSSSLSSMHRTGRLCLKLNKNTRITSLYHYRPCSIVLESRSYRIDFTVVCFVTQLNL